MLSGVRVYDLRTNVDERGIFTEVFRQDWKELLGDDKIVQANLSLSHPGTIRAWHRHSRGQVDYLVVLDGSVKICVFDERESASTKAQLEEIVSSGQKLQAVRVPGHYWHGTKTLGHKPSLTLYFMNRLYDSTNPDEERRPWNDPSIVDPNTSKPFDWNKPPHK
jgi:dTDP-4-dehydrorhamnose 3,5-epimerase